MSRDYAEKEREFIEGLKADTGRDLGEWMAAIGKRNFAHRNDAIDWLRQQGFLFSWASWLERIHHNGGQPIYCDPSLPTDATAPPKRPSSPPQQPKPSTSRDTERAAPPPAGQPIRLDGASVIQFPGARSAPPKAPAPNPARLATSPSASASPEVMAVVAAAKAYAPLAGFLIRCISDSLPGTTFRAGAKHIEMYAGPLPFALLAVGGRDLKLAYAGPPERFEAPAEKVRLPNLGAPVSPLLTHMVALSDAREIDEAFIESLREARARVGGK